MLCIWSSLEEVNKWSKKAVRWNVEIIMKNDASVVKLVIAKKRPK